MTRVACPKCGEIQHVGRWYPEMPKPICKFCLGVERTWEEEYARDNDEVDEEDYDADIHD